MNVKVTQLSRQAGNYADVKCQEGAEFYPCYTQKFVELLVKECGNFTDPVTRRLMMQHFGVEDV
jgi:hypothetical protein